MKLYYAPGACSLSPHIVLLELGLPHTLEKVDLKAKTTESGQNFLDVNPKGYVPVLQLEGGQVLTEGPAIVQYLASLKPAGGLAPAPGSWDHFRMLEWLNFISTELHKSFGALFHGGPEEVLKTTRERLRGRLDYVAGQLQGKDFLLGSDFSLADAYLFTVLSWAEHVKLDLPKPLQAYRDRVSGRPRVQEALQAEGLLASTP